MTYEMDVLINKGDGREGLANQFDIAMLIGGPRVTPGVWRLTIERVGPVPKGEEG